MERSGGLEGEEYIPSFPAFRVLSREINRAFVHIQIVNGDLQTFADPHTRVEQQQNNGGVPVFGEVALIKDSEQPFNFVILHVFLWSSVVFQQLHLQHGAGLTAFF